MAISNLFRRSDKTAAAPEAIQKPAAAKKPKAKDVDVILPDQIEHLKHMLPASLSLKSTHLIINNIFQTVLLVTKWPSHIDDLTLTRLYQLPDVTILLDINKRPKGQTITEISKSMDELQSRSVVNTSTGDDLKDQYELQDMMQLHSELILGNEYMVSLTMRLVVTAPTEKALKTRAENLKDTLANEYGIQTIIPEFEMEDNLRAMLFPANSVSQPFPVVGTLARQYMFSQQDHADPAGSYFGHTASGGRIILDPFRTTHNRNSYDLLLMGLKGSGKSVSLKAMIQDMVCQGHRVLTLDVEGEQIALANALGGVVVRPGSGATSAQINPLEIRPRGLNETSDSDFGSEISRIESFFYQYAPDLTDKEAEVLKQLLQQTYLTHGITERTPLQEMTPEQFPRMSDLLLTIRSRLYTAYTRLPDGNISAAYNSMLADGQRDILSTLESYVASLAEGTYSAFFNHHSTVDLMASDFIVFDVSGIMSMAERVANALLFNILSLMWLDITRNRERNQQAGDNRTYCVAVVDEAHRFLNADNPHGIKFIERMLRQARKYDAGLWFASQSPRDFVPSGNDALLDKIKNIFSLVQYKVVLRQDESSVPLLLELMPQFTESELKSTTQYSSGDMLISLGAGDKYYCHRYVSQDDLKLFGGGRE